MEGFDISQFLQTFKEDVSKEKEKEKSKKGKNIIEGFLKKKKSKQHIEKYKQKQKKGPRQIKSYLPTAQEKELVDEEKITYNTCLKYYYPNPEDFANVEEGGLNLSCKPRKWTGGRIAFNDGLEYRPINMHNYIRQYFINNFEIHNRQSPFQFREDYIDKTLDELCGKSGDFELKPHQKFAGQFISPLTDFPGEIVYHRLGSGKCLGYDTPIVMYDGSIKMVQDVKVGDVLMGEDSNPRNVLNLVRGKDIMYDVIPIKGDTFGCNSEHILSLKCNNTEEVKKYLKQFDIKSKTCDIAIKDFLKLPKRIQNQLKLYRVGVEFPTREVPVEPYIIGLWFNHIPKIYIINSRQVRLELLAGLIDADGNNYGGYYKYVQNNEKRAEEVMYLARSLGFSAYKRKKKTSLTHKDYKKYGFAFSITISGNVNEIPVKIKREMVEHRKQKKDTSVIGFKLIEKPIDYYYGFTLDGNNRFLLGDFTVTHNSCTSIIIAESNKGRYLDLEGSINPITGRTTTTSIKRSNICRVTVVVPNAIVEQYKQEIIGNIQNGNIKSCTGACVIYTEEDGISSYRQVYAGEIMKDNNGRYKKDESGNYIYKNEFIAQIKTIEKNIILTNNKLKQVGEQLDRLQIDLEQEEMNDEYEMFLLQEQQILQKTWNKLRDNFDTFKNQLKDLKKNNENRIGEIYYITTHTTYTNRLSEKLEGKGKHTASNYLLGEKREDMPHPDCFHSQKSLLIIDEIQKLVREGGANYMKLFHALFIYARNLATGNPAMKVVLLSATPVFDNPHEMAMMYNLIRPRIQFPLERAVFENYFIKKDPDRQIPDELKNPLLLKYMVSGYTSYFQGGNPIAYPYRRNHVQLHVMKENQLKNYTDVLIREIEKDMEKNNKRKNKMDSEPLNIADKVIMGSEERDNRQENMYQKSRKYCNTSLPTTAGGNPIKTEQGRIRQLKKELNNEKTDDLRKKLFENYSSKFKWICDKIIESSEKNEGPIFVYSFYVYNGLLTLTTYLETMGWSVLTNEELRSTPENLLKRNQDNNLKKFGIWSSDGYKYYNPGKERERIEYQKNLQNMFNHQLNENGELCKVILTTVQEGISLLRVNQVHICEPWWNESRMEQIIGRSIRFCSHSDIESKKQKVDVYYHCSILPSYPQMDPIINSKVGNFRDLARTTIEQRVYNRAEAKNHLNVQFEQAMKESAVDYELNKLGNIIRLEEFVFPDYRTHNSLKDIGALIKIPDKTTILYDRTTNKYYLDILDKISENKTYQIEYGKILKNEKQLIKIELIRTLSDGKYDREVFPPIGFKEIRNNEGKVDTITIARYSQLYDDNNITMASAINYEKIKPFNNTKEGSMNFIELMKYATKNGEEKTAWKYFNNMRVKTELLGTLIGAYGISESRGTNNIYDCVTKTMTKPINRNDYPFTEEGEHNYNVDMVHKKKLKSLLVKPDLKKTEEGYRSILSMKGISQELLENIDILELKIMYELLEKQIIDVPSLKLYLQSVDEGGLGEMAFHELINSAIASGI